jgi:hypothetical protein
VLRAGVAGPRDSPDAATLSSIAGRVAKRSGGRLRIHVVYADGASASPGSEPRVARLVEHGRLDMAYVDARVWDELGVHSLQALEAPFLIRDDADLVAVVKSPMGDRMLAGLRRIGITGLALIPYLLNHPVAIGRPLVSLADFRGARVGIPPSRALDDLVRALGATPVPAVRPAPGHAAAPGIDALVMGIFGMPAGVSLTANVDLPPDVKTVVVNSVAFRRLSGEDRDALRAAVAAERAGYVGADRLSEAEIIAGWCTGTGPPSALARIALATPAQLAELAHAAEPVYRDLARDPATRAMIAGIRGLVASVPPLPALKIRPTGCRPAARASTPTGSPREASALNGTYRYILTKADARAHGTPNDTSAEGLAHYPSCFSVTLRDGRWLMESCSAAGGSDTGTYVVRADRLTFVSPALSSRLTFTFSVDRARTLRLVPVLPMEDGDRFVMSTEPWRWIGPPVKPIP